MTTTSEETPRCARILVVEDEEAIAQGLVLNLGRRGHEAELVMDGREALERASTERFDLILLDVRLPGMDGFEICQRLRREGNFTPVLVLTARSQPDDVVYGLEVGADDYVVKPFDLAELMARVEGLLRRQSWSKSDDDGAGDPDGEGDEAMPTGRYEFGEYWVDFGSFQAKTDRGVEELSKKEMAVLRLFASRPGQVIDRRELLADVWELPDHPNTRVVDNVIVALRKAFGDNSLRPRHFHTVRGVGYRFTP
jgi:two-component system alkaline phosphatase synthesis response regulator PhoP